MYEVDEKDDVVELPDIPQSCPGAPNPLVLADEHTLLVAYYVEEGDPAWEGTSVRIVGPTTDGEPLALLQFKPYSAMLFGPPNDEAFAGHPLADRGLHPYGAFRIQHSSWIRRLERMNSVHDQHRPQAFEGLTHYVLAFHDSTLECVAEAVSFTLSRSSIRDLVAEMHTRLGWGGA